MKLIILAFIMFLIVAVLLVHQFFVHGVWFELEDLHHEGWMCMFAFAGLILLFIRK